MCFSWGCDHEKQAIAQYVEAVSPQHVNFETKESGLVINPSYPHLGASPDAFVSCDCCGSGTLEIKCPYCVKTESPENAVEMLTYLETDGDDVHLKETETYFYQIQAQLNICEVEYGDFVVWTEKGIYVERICVQREFFIEAIGKIEDFYKYSILPELLGKWYTKQPVLPSSKGVMPTDSSATLAGDDTALSTNSDILAPATSHMSTTVPLVSNSSDTAPINTSTQTVFDEITPTGISRSTLTFSDSVATSSLDTSSTSPCDNAVSTYVDTSSVQLWCYCRQPDDSSEDMIACDYPSCTIEWFHMSCLRLHSFPKGKWYCPDCRKKFKGKHPPKTNKTYTKRK